MLHSHYDEYIRDYARGTLRKILRLTEPVSLYGNKRSTQDAAIRLASSSEKTYGTSIP